MPTPDPLVVEREELTSRIQALYQEINSPAFEALTVSERKLLASQYHHMTAYQTILGERIGINPQNEEG